MSKPIVVVFDFQPHGSTLEQRKAFVLDPYWLTCAENDVERDRIVQTAIHCHLPSQAILTRYQTAPEDLVQDLDVAAAELDALLGLSPAPAVQGIAGEE